MINNILQWAGTACLITMYVVMSFFPDMYPLNIVMGLLGGSFYFAWCLRVSNRPQMIVNAAGILVCCAGLVKAYLA
jgi:hypothetical protein